jgi:hypothetical protein
MADHQTVRLIPPDPDPGVAIDVGIAPLIHQCWRLGLHTNNCCEGDNSHDAYISFRERWQAELFAAAAGPFAWNDRVQRRRDRESAGRPEAWRWSWWRWRLEGATVRFPHRDIGRAEDTLRARGSLGVRVGAHIENQNSRLSAPPRLCPICGEVVLARRRDARYCSRRCQLAARHRGRDRLVG